MQATLLEEGRPFPGFINSTLVENRITDYHLQNRNFQSCGIMSEPEVKGPSCGIFRHYSAPQNYLTKHPKIEGRGPSGQASI